LLRTNSQGRWGRPRWAQRRSVPCAFQVERTRQGGLRQRFSASRMRNFSDG
jgi:hypothetical protein